MKKFEALLNSENGGRGADRGLDSRKVVRNLSQRSLTESKTNVLALGLNFAVTPKTVPVVDIIAAVECAANELLEERALEFRAEVKKCLQNAKKPRPNLSREQREALKKLREDDSIVILPADKGNATVVMNKEDYDKKMADILDGGDYAVVKTNPIPKLEKKVNELLKELWVKEEINKTGYDRLRNTYSATPQLYGLPKIHKPEVPLRPIVSSIDSPTYNLAKFLTRIVSPLAGKSPSFVKDSGDFVEKARKLKLEEGSTLVSFDVTSLFTRVPIAEALEVIGRRLEEQEAEERRTTLSVESVKRLLHLCLTSTYFMWNGRFYEQKEGAAMGNPLSPVVANIYMEHFEELALESAESKPATWLRYVDDTFVIWNKGRDKLLDFLEHLNSIRPSIQFTMELEEDRKLPFLDVMVTRRDDRLSTSVYRKQTHTDRYIHFSSSHHDKVKRGVIQCLRSRAVRICEAEELEAEEEHLRTTFRKNGYPRGFITGAMKSRREQEETQQAEEPERKTLCVLPYVRGTSDKLGNVCKKLGVQPVFQQRRTLRSLLTRVKGPQKHVDKGVVYQIPCAQCDEVYIGETGRPLKTRITEHKRAVREGDARNANAVHCMRTSHSMDWDAATVVDRASRWRERRIKESVHIRKKKTCNMDLGFPLSPVWNSLIRPIED